MRPNPSLELTLALLEAPSDCVETQRVMDLIDRNEIAVDDAIRRLEQAKALRDLRGADSRADDDLPVLLSLRRV